MRPRDRVLINLLLLHSFANAETTAADDETTRTSVDDSKPQSPNSNQWNEPNSYLFSQCTNYIERFRNEVTEMSTDGATISASSIDPSTPSEPAENMTLVEEDASFNFTSARISTTTLYTPTELATDKTEVTLGATTTTTSTPLTTTIACNLFEHRNGRLVKERNGHYEGCRLLANFERILEEGCRLRCLQMAGCVAFVYSPEISPHCELYASTSRRRGGSCDIERTLGRGDWTVHEIRRDCRSLKPTSCRDWQGNRSSRPSRRRTNGACGHAYTSRMTLSACHRHCEVSSWCVMYVWKRPNLCSFYPHSPLTYPNGCKTEPGGALTNIAYKSCPTLYFDITTADEN